MNRRKALKLGAGLGVLAGAGIFAGYEILPPRRSRELEPVDTLARRLYTSLDDNQRADTCVAYDHPLRQYHNRGVWGGGRAVIFGFNRDQRQILTDLLYSGLSNEGRDRVPEEYFSRWSGVESMRVLICGDPTSSAYQIILTAAHLNLRLGGKSREGAAFGGPQVYGDQRGNNRVGLPGNLYRDQFLLAQRLFQSLDSGRQKQAVLAFGTNPAWLDRAGVKALFERALRWETGADLAYYDEGVVAGRLRKGVIRTGDIYSLESWQERVEVVTIRGANLSARLLAQLQKQRVGPDSNKTYKVATTSYLVSDDSEKLGRIDNKQQGSMLRDVTIAYLRSHGFASV